MSLSPEQLTEGVTLHCGDNRDVLRAMPDCSVDSVVTDPPYALVSIVKRFGADNAAPCKVPEGGTGAYARASGGFMGKKWDTGEVAFDPAFWNECLRVLKPGGHLIAFSGTRTYHRIACAIEDAGFEIRDQIGWAYGSGFPKSHDVSKGIDKMLGADREKVRDTNPRNPKATGGGRDGMEGATRPWIETAIARGYHEKDGPIPATAAAAAWDGWGTALKPAWEPVVVARKPLIGTVAENLLTHGAGAINIDGCRVDGPKGWCDSKQYNPGHLAGGSKDTAEYQDNSLNPSKALGRWPANIIHDGSDEVLAAFPESSGQQGALKGGEASKAEIYGKFGPKLAHEPRNDSGSAARFFYTAKADANDRLGSKHPTVKPVDLMQWLVRLVTPKGGLVLDPFAGTGTTAEACIREGMRCVLIEREEEYQADIRRRMKLAMAGPDERKRESIKAKHADKPADFGPLFGGTETPPAAQVGKSTASSQTKAADAEPRGSPGRIDMPA